MSGTIGDGKQIIQLEPGTAILHNATWGAAKIKVRPPLSKVWELSTKDTEQLLTGGVRPQAIFSEQAQELLELIRSHQVEHQEALHLSEAFKLLGITSKRQLGLVVAELEKAGAVRTRKLRQRGQPRVLEVISSETTGPNPDGTGPEHSDRATETKPGRI